MRWDFEEALCTSPLQRREMGLGEGGVGRGGVGWGLAGSEVTEE